MCYDFSWINDEEFQFMRQEEAVECKDYAADFADWSEANGFVSQWNLLQSTR